MNKVVVIGGGASGLMASYSASSMGKHVVLLEKNEKLGKKIYITGKGRCNVTACVANEEFLCGVVCNSKFMYSAINTLSCKDFMSLLETNGLTLKVERGNRVFPNSDKASDVTKTLEKMIKNNGVDVRLGVNAKRIITNNNKIVGVETDCGDIEADSVIVCCGGVSYPLTGSTGDGYAFAKTLGHTIIQPKPSLVGIELKGNDFVEMQGVSLKNVKLYAMSGEKVLYSDFGEMLFTHFGVSGPIVLSCSTAINRIDLNLVKISIDLKPAIDFQTLDKRLISEFKENNTKNLFTVMRAVLPKALINVVLRRAKLNPEKKCCEITVAERQNLVNVLKSLVFEVKKLRPIDEAIVTAGGVCVKEVNPKTMESKLIKGLYFAGEVLDVDGYTGGYNLQIAWSTGFVAGKNC